MNTVTKVKEVKNDAIFLFNDIDTFLSFKKKQDRVFEVFEELKELAVKSLGNIEIDFEALLFDPSNFLIDTYFKVYKPAPEHLKNNAKQIFENHCNIKITHLVKLDQEFRQAMKDMQQHIPSITKTGLKSNLHIKNFDKYLNPKKEMKYKSLVKFVKAADEIKAMENGTQGIHLVRFCSGLIFEGLDIKINYHEFCN